MKETQEILMKRTRSELSEMAEKLGIDTAGISKTKIADFIFEARNKTEKPLAEEASKPRAAAPKAKKAFKAQPMPHIGTNIGKKGVFAKRAAISAQMDENAEAVAAIGTGVMEMQTSINDMMVGMNNFAFEMRKEGSENLLKGVHVMHKGVDEMQKSFKAQIKVNEKAAAKMGTGIKEMHKDIQDLQSAFNDKTHQIQIGVKEMHSGVKMIQKGIHQMESKFGEYRNETANYIKDFYYG
jgi:hypothetical protein